MTPTNSACLTDAGMVRDHNEDAYAALPELGLWVVADGMGGHDDGEVASGIAVERIPAYVRTGQSLADAIRHCHHDIRNAPSQGIGSAGMGTTVVAALVRDGAYEIAWVGDSRAYLASGAQVQQITRDHSVVQHLLDSGVITPEEAVVHPNRNMIIQSLGSDSIEDLRVDTIHGRLHSGERLLLCSDGLSGELADSELAATLHEEPDSGLATHRLIERAKARGGHDNITAILIDAPSGAKPRPAPRPTRKKKAVRHGP